MFLRYNIFTILWCGLIFVLALAPSRELPRTVYWNLLSFDKVAHMFFYFILCLQMIIGFRKQHQFKRLKHQGEFFAILIAFGISLFIELVQGVLPSRSFEFSDLAANFIGCMSGYAVFLLIYRL
ncbi:MAG: VanZ family protein [Cytophagales bacterium]|nr:VanZ family protein [Cytophagales bacterium]